MQLGHLKTGSAWDMQKRASSFTVYGLGVPMGTNGYRVGAARWCHSKTPDRHSVSIDMVLTS